MAEPILDASGVVSGIGQGVAAGVAEHVGVNRQGEATASILSQPLKADKSITRLRRPANGKDTTGSWGQDRRFSTPPADVR
jgi:hypothetical protein